MLSPAALDPAVVLAGCLAGTAAALAVPGRRRAPVRASQSEPDRSPRSARSRSLVLVPLGVGSFSLWAGWTDALLTLHVGLVAATAAGVAALVRRGRRRREAQAAAGRILEACTALADELGAGRGPEAALAEAAQACPELAPAVRAARLGADVPSALRRATEGTGHRDLRLVAAAWQVAHRSGEGLADALGRVATDLRATAATRRVVASELASARSTARLLVALPALALVAGSGTGGEPWRFLLGTAAGTGCLVAGLGLLLAGSWWIEAIAADVEEGW